MYKNIFLCILIFSGRFSLDRIGLQVPFVFNDFRFILLLLLFIFPLGKRRKLYQKSEYARYHRVFLSQLFFLFYCICTYFWTYDYIESLPKLYDLIILLLLIYLIHMHIEKSNFRVIVNFLHISLFLLFLLSVLSWFNVSDSSESRIPFGGKNVFGRLMIIGFYLSYYHFIKLKYIKKLFFVLLCFYFFNLILFSGSRGAFVSFFISFVGFLIINTNKLFILDFKKMRFFLVTLICSIPFIMMSGKFSYIKTRYIDLLFYDLHDAGRFNRFDEAYQLFKENIIFGSGIDSFAKGNPGGYPHNIFLEVASETGIIGIILLSLLLINLYIGWKKIFLLEQYIFFVIALSIFLTTQFSGDIYDSRYFFIYSLFSVFPSQIKELDNRL